ncbi:flagellar hook-associated protein 1 FlgK [Litorivivens lipolytica]|uniref:Flagellar hook-associated protein 1 n=1 Tax=Litorivivens lipolytica TaxID=1524264 RepID=A0A7W4W3S6_9GAMM|nr:flagellar hook-associated protein FlgK [Litorivivens lipolytica]MBB3046377.1 flagellar hook-associated protein 1 FlgK [Litorivivens lipolytica]
MADMMNSALSAIVSYQRALATTSHNIANVNTEGYSRQSVSLSTNVPQNFGFGAIGSGVRVSTIERQFDQFVVDQMRNSSSSYHQAQAYTDLAAQVDRLLSDPNSGISSALSSFFNSMQQLSDDPSSIPARQGVLAEADNLTSRLASVAGQFSGISQEINTRMRSSVEEINGLSSHIAELNEAITRARAQTGGNEPNDLLDQRDQALLELSSFMDIKVVKQDGDTMNVFTSTGESIVLNNRSMALGVTGSEFDPTRLEITLESDSGTREISGLIRGGSLGGVLNFREELMDPALAQLGRMSYGLAEAANSQHRAGMTLNGELGGDLFSIASPEGVASRNNTGGALVTVGITDTGDLTTDNYLLQYNGTSYQLFNARTGAAEPTTGTGTAADPLLAAGMSISLSTTPATGDRFLIKPTSNMSGSLELAISRPDDLAAAAATRVSAASTNRGDAALVSSSVIDATDPQLLTTATLEFLSPTTYQINGAGSFTYTPGTAIDINGSRLTLDGTPAAGDRFTLSSNSGGVGDNRNALALANLQDRGLFEGGNTSVMDSATTLLGDVAVATRASSVQASSQLSLLEQSVARRESVSGVNLEEEAANMLRFQQAYQAASQAVSTSNSLFQTLINAFR